MNDLYSDIEWSNEVRATLNSEGVPAHGAGEFSTCCACGLWSLFMCGCFGRHRFYLGDTFCCIVQFFNFGPVGVQTLRDFCLIDELFDERNSEIREKVSAKKAMMKLQRIVVVRQNGQFQNRQLQRVAEENENIPQNQRNLIAIKKKRRRK